MLLYKSLSHDTCRIMGYLPYNIMSWRGARTENLSLLQIFRYEIRSAGIFCHLNRRHAGLFVTKIKPNITPLSQHTIYNRNFYPNKSIRNRHTNAILPFRFSNVRLSMSVSSSCRFIFACALPFTKSKSNHNQNI